METYQLVTVIVLALSLGVQGVNLASRALMLKNYQDYDNSLGITTFVDINSGYITFGLVSASISSAIYIVLLVVVLLKKQMGEIFDTMAYQAYLMFQFAFATSLAVQLKNQEA
jgi:hypothetical protein